MPMTLAQAMTAEFQQEAANTRKMLERVPEDKLDWKPHEKSMSLGRLAGHIAESVAWVGDIVGSEELDFAQSDFKPFTPQSGAELLEELALLFGEFLRGHHGHENDLVTFAAAVDSGDSLAADANPRTGLRARWYRDGLVSVDGRDLDVRPQRGL